MDRGLRVLSVVLLLSAACGMLATDIALMRAASAAAASTAQPAPPASPGSKVACPGCHGPFEKLVAKTDYLAPSGEKISPHRYVPHSAKEMKAIPGCDNCHAPHAIPSTSAGVKALPKPDVQWCYTACHHKNTFQLCKDCHK